MAIVFCVGSRNRRIGAPFCSRICCSYSTKQALTVLDRNSQAEITCFYMDVRTYDRGFEEMYSLAQERGIRYIRGRVSGCKELPGGDIVVRAENTLVQKIFSDRFDMVSLSTGMRPCLDVDHLANVLGIDRAPDGFFASREWFRLPARFHAGGNPRRGLRHGHEANPQLHRRRQCRRRTRRGSVARQSDRRRDCGNDLKAGRSGPAAMPTAAPPDDKREPWFRVHPAFFANSDVWPYDS